jgi:[ribosomal protein S5]-alanine N-acetyltransferase
MDLFAKYPALESDTLALRKIEPADVDDLFTIYANEMLFRYTPGSARKTRDAVQNMIGHFQRDFGKRKTLFLGICLRSDPEHIVGVMETFDYDPKVKCVTIGYRLNDAFWGRGIAAKAVGLMVEYLFTAVGINRIQAFVMPENEKSHAVLVRNGFTREGVIRQSHLWTGKGIVDLTLYSLLRTDPR